MPDENKDQFKHSLGLEQLIRLFFVFFNVDLKGPQSPTADLDDAFFS